ncbi:MAG: hypothetical protein JRJ87_08795 [Deltaproteobacteria bacterium]|nr:hypothetical protein [Deltaproteobacteria bacterium]
MRGYERIGRVVILAGLCCLAFGLGCENDPQQLQHKQAKAKSKAGPVSVVPTLVKAQRLANVIKKFKRHSEKSITGFFGILRANSRDCRGGLKKVRAHFAKHKESLEEIFLEYRQASSAASDSERAAANQTALADIQASLRRVQATLQKNLPLLKSYRKKCPKTANELVAEMQSFMSTIGKMKMGL